MARLIKEIANEILKEWKNPSEYARMYAWPYLKAMTTLNTVKDKYYLEDGDEIILRFLTNAGSFKGEAARRLKKELKSLVGL